MTWKEKWYGTDNKSALHKCAMNFIVVGPLLCIFGLWVDFVSSEHVWRWGSYLALAFTIASIALISWGFSVGQIKSKPGFVFTGRQGVLAAMGVLLVVGGTWWMLVVRVIPDIFTQLIGDETRITVPMRAIYKSSRRSCDYKLEGKVLDRAFPAYLCTSQSAFSAFPSDVVVALQVKQSFLGIHIQHAAESKSANNAFKSDVAEAARP